MKNNNVDPLLVLSNSILFTKKIYSVNCNNKLNTFNQAA